MSAAKQKELNEPEARDPRECENEEALSLSACSKISHQAVQLQGGQRRSGHRGEEEKPQRGRQTDSRNRLDQRAKTRQTHRAAESAEHDREENPFLSTAPRAGPQNEQRAAP